MVPRSLNKYMLRHIYLHKIVVHALCREMCDRVTVRQKQWSHGGGVTGSEIITLLVHLSNTLV